MIEFNRLFKKYNGRWFIYDDDGELIFFNNEDEPVITRDE